MAQTQCAMVSWSPMQQHRSTVRPRSICLALLVFFAIAAIVIQLYQYRWRTTIASRPQQQPVQLPAALKAWQPNQQASDATRTSRPVYRFPKLIHQTVRDRGKLTCQQRRVADSWRTLNPGYAHRLWDDHDIREFMLQYYPDLVPIPFDDFLTGAERSDLWRVLVLHKLGGVYADMDVQCLKPIDDWNAEHGHDAQVLLGMENYAADRQHPIHVVNWVLASTPGHPLLGSMPDTVSKSTQHQFFEVMRHKGSLVPDQVYEAGIIDRTGPAALSWAMYDYFAKIGQNMSAVNEITLTSVDGFVAGGVRVLPVQNMASGWEVAAARKKGLNFTCDHLADKTPDAYVCHMFFGSWRSQWNYKVDGTESC